MTQNLQHPKNVHIELPQPPAVPQRLRAHFVLKTVKSQVVALQQQMHELTLA